MNASLAGDVPTAAEIRAMIEQVYRMESWHTGDQVDYPPVAHGRWVIMQGGVVSTLIKGNPDGSKYVVALYGRYEVEDGVFRYLYEDGSAAVMSGDGTAPASIPVTFGEFMVYEVRRDGDGLRLRNGDAELRLTPRGIDYCEGRAVQRTWLRLNPS
jgi:hypothetical protein